MLENLLKTDFIDVVNSAPVRRGDAPIWTKIPQIRVEDVADFSFVCNKRGTAKLQLSYTIDLLCRSERIKNFIKDIPNKWCILSARDERVLQTPSGMADAFMNAYEIIPKPLKFQFGPMKRLGFIGYETSKVILE